MANRRMFCKDVVETDQFLDLPASAQSFYFHLGMNADDDGFVGNFKSYKRMYGASDDDAKLLYSKGFIYPFDSGVVVITHWKVHNYIKKDRYQKTIHQREYEQLSVMEDKAYAVNAIKTGTVESVPNLYPFCIQAGTEMEPQVSIGKSQDRVGKVRESDAVAYKLGDEILYQDEYDELTQRYSKVLVDGLIKRIMKTPYRGKLNAHTIESWARERKTSGRPETPTAKSKFGDIAATLISERRA